MSFLQFPDKKYVKTIDTSEIVRLGSINIVDNIELQYIRPSIFIYGALGGIEQIRVNLYGDENHLNKIFSSSWRNLSEISMSTNYWLGWIRCDFARQNINKNITYYLSVELNNYTRNGETFWIGLNRDYPTPTYDNSEDLWDGHPLAFQIFGYK